MAIVFFSFFFFGNVMNHKHEALWLLKKCTLYILCTLILSNPLHLTIGWSLILIQNKLWITKCCRAHSEVFNFMFKIYFLIHQDFSQLCIYHICYTSFFWMKSGSPAMCFHPWVKAQYEGANLGNFITCALKTYTSKCVAFNYGFHFWCLGFLFWFSNF